MLWWIAPSERSWNDEKDIGHQKPHFAEYAVYPAGAVCYQFWRGMANGNKGRMLQKSFFRWLRFCLGRCKSFWPSLHPLDLLVGLCCGVGLRLAVYLKSKNAKKYRHGLEYGSARWGTREDIAPYVDPVFQNNVILTKTESLDHEQPPQGPQDCQKQNVLVDWRLRFR